MRDVGAFDAAYGRLSATRIACGPVRDAPPDPSEGRVAPSGRHETPRSRLLPRLALMAPGRGGLRRPGG